MVNGDLCACRCCPVKDCVPQTLPNIFHVDRCWLGGGRECLDLCRSFYPRECGSSTSFAVPFCNDSLTVSFNILIILISIFIHQLIIH
ncbi:unnamed protein product [Adineta steineri]|uniref:Uncharacterized protein n=1 Tax=Adineta steineri TaxID=433720 RepID=A0A818V8M1_9BILA|nr:unnamed protein product [Adineta steineri]CAF3711519.1 unnamed protein product [Adineta steineri]